MNSPLKEMMDAVRSECQRFGCIYYNIDISGKHAHAVFIRHGKKRMVSFSKTPSCKFAPHKVQRNVRHALMELGYVKVTSA